MILNTEFGLIWTTPWPDAKELFLKFSKIRNSRKSQNSVWKPKFFLGTLYHFFALHWWYSIPRLVWFGQLLNRWKKPIFKTSFSRNSKSSVWKPNLFPNQAKPKKLFALYSHCTGDTPYRVWFDLDNSLTRWKNLFLKVLFREIQKVPYEKPNFFLGKPNQYFLPYTVITLVILNTEFGLLWATPWPDEKQLILKFSKIRNSRNLQNSVWKPIFFPLQAIPTNFWLYTVITLVIPNTEFGLIWTTPWPNEEELF